MKYIKLEHAIAGAYWNSEEGLWEVKVKDADGHEFVDKCHVLINGGGILK